MCHFPATAPSPIQLHLQVANCTFKLPTAPSINPNRISSNKHKMVHQRKTIHRRKTHGRELKIRVSRRIVKLSIEWKPESPKRSDDGFPLKLYFVVFEAVGYSKCVNYIGTVLCHTICALKNN